MKLTLGRFRVEIGLLGGREFWGKLIRPVGETTTLQRGLGLIYGRSAVDPYQNYWAVSANWWSLKRGVLFLQIRGPNMDPKYLEAHGRLMEPSKYSYLGYSLPNWPCRLGCIDMRSCNGRVCMKCITIQTGHCETRLGPGHTLCHHPQQGSAPAPRGVA